MALLSPTPRWILAGHEFLVVCLETNQLYPWEFRIILGQICNRAVTFNIVNNNKRANKKENLKIITTEKNTMPQDEYKNI